MSNFITPLSDSRTLGARAKQVVASALEDAEAVLTEHTDDPGVARQALADAVLALAQRPTESEWTPAPLAFDFTADLPAPDWIVTRAIERGTVVVLSGDTGAAKSIVTSSLLAAALDEAEWLGLPTRIDRMTVIDEENPQRLVNARLRALGIENDAREKFRYFSREGIAIGDEGRTDAWLRAHLEDFRPDLLIVDTLMAACAVEDTNSNSEAVRTMKLLRSFAREYDCAVLLLHHERKQSKDHPNSSGQAMMGARQWAGQADAHMTLTAESALVETDAESEGHKSLVRKFKWKPAEKDRDGRSNCAQRISVASEKDADGRLLWMLVENEGEIDEQPTETDALAVQIGAFVQQGDGESTTADIARGVGRDPQDSTFKRALALAEDREYVEKIKRGRYAPGKTPVLDVG